MSSHKRFDRACRRPRPWCRWPCSPAPGPRASRHDAASAEPRDSRAGTLPDGTSVPDQAIEAPASVSGPGEIAPGVPSGDADAGRRRRLHQRHPVGRAGGLPARRARSSTPPTRPATSPGSWSPRSAGSSPTTAATAATPSTSNGVAAPGHLRHRRSTARNGTARSATPTPASTTTTRSTTARSARCSSSPRPGRSSAWTPTATASATRRTSTTRRWRPRSTSAPATTTSSTDGRPARPRSTATTTASDYVDLVLSIMRGLPRRRLHLRADQLGRDDHVHPRLRRLGVRLGHDRLPLPEGQERHQRSGARGGSTSARHDGAVHAPPVDRVHRRRRSAVGNPTRGGGATSDPGGTVGDTVKTATGGGTPPRHSRSSTRSTRSPRRRRSAARSSPASPATAP